MAVSESQFTLFLEFKVEYPYYVEYKYSLEIGFDNKMLLF